MNGVLLFFYNALLCVARPFILLRYVVRSRTDGKYRTSYLQRMGIELPSPRDPSRKRFWIHALSVGETVSVVPLVRALRELFPSWEIVFSTATETGRAVAEVRLAGIVDVVLYCPHDFPRAVRTFVRRIRPDAFLLIETDVWPNLLRVLRKEGVWIALVNGRISPKSFRRLHCFAWAVGPMLNRFHRIFVQSADDVQRFASLGVDSDRIVAAGNLKFDASSGDVSVEELTALRATSGIEEGRTVWAAGSTHEGEEELLLGVHRSLLRKYPGLLLLLAPRNPRRGESLAALCASMGFDAVCRSLNESAHGKTVYILDTLGELGAFYRTANVAFIGGSLVPFGGHNPLEAAVCGIPTLWGPHLFNFREMESALITAGCSGVVRTAEELDRLLGKWLESPGLCAEVGAAAGNFMKRHSGVSLRIARIVAEEIEILPMQ